MKDREKIIGIIDKWANRAVITKINGASVYDQNNATELTNALIAANIGDVTEWKEKAKKHRVQVLPDGTIKQLYSDEEVEDIALQRDEHKHRAQVAENELKLYKLAVKIWQERYSDIRCFNFNIALRQAEKELAEEGEE